MGQVKGHIGEGQMRIPNKGGLTTTSGCFISKFFWQMSTQTAKRKKINNIPIGSIFYYQLFTPHMKIVIKRSCHLDFRFIIENIGKSPKINMFINNIYLLFQCVIKLRAMPVLGRGSALIYVRIGDFLFFKFPSH